VDTRNDHEGQKWHTIGQGDQLFENRTTFKLDFLYDFLYLFSLSDKEQDINPHAICAPNLKAIQITYNFYN